MAEAVFLARMGALPLTADAASPPAAAGRVRRRAADAAVALLAQLQGVRLRAGHAELMATSTSASTS